MSLPARTSIRCHGPQRKPLFVPAEMIGGKLAEPTEAEALARAKFSTRGLEIALAHARNQSLGFVLLALVALFALRAPGFATLDNVSEVLRDLSILGILAIGETFVVIGGGIDLSIGSVLLLAGIVSDDLIRLEEVSTGVTIPVALVVGCLVGALNGLLITRLRLSTFIVTLATLYIIRGIACRCTARMCTTCKRPLSQTTIS